ncbi:MAG: insulinase family protein [Gammaproteobacteria bacterium]|nr:insulinase family protein [Gammaproteobacteria bacterium]
MKLFIHILAVCTFCIISNAQADNKKPSQTTNTGEITKNTSAASKVTYKKGTLDNGLEFLIFKIPDAGDRIDVRLQVGVGSIDESADEYGSAHMLEHMVFQGGKKFPEGAWDYLMKKGWSRGSQYNASTGYEKTTYTLSPPKGKAQIETLFPMLADMMFKPTLTAKAWEKERKIVLQERLMRQSPMSRMRIQRVNLTLHNSKYTQSEIIGNLEDIQNRNIETLKKFHNKWYQPNNMKLLVTIGDVDIKEIESRIQKHFSSAPQKKLPSRADNYYEPQLKSGWKIGQIQDKDNGSSIVSIMFRSQEPWKIHYTEKDYSKQVKESIIEGIAISAIKNRFKKISKTLPDNILNVSFFKSSVGNYTAIVGINANIPPTEHQTALEKLFYLREQILRYPVTEKETEEYRKYLKLAIEKKKEDPDFPEKFGEALSIARNILFNESPILTPLQQAEILEKELSTVELTDVNKLLQRWLTSEDRILKMQAAGMNKIDLPDADTLQTIVEKTRQLNISPPPTDNDKKLSNTMKPSTKSGVINKEINYPEHNVTEWQLANGDRFVYLQHETAKKNAILTIDSPIGFLANNINPWQAALATKVIWQSGPDGFDEKSIKMWRKQHKASIYVRKFKGKRWQMSGVSKKETIEQLLQLYQSYVMSAQVGDSLRLARIKSLQLLQDPVYQKNIKTREALSKLIYGQIEYAQPTANDLKTLTSEDLLKQWQIINDVPVNYYLIANVPNTEIKTLVEKYLAGIPRTKKTVNFRQFEPVENLQSITKKILKLGSEQRDDFNAIAWKPQASSPKNDVIFKSAKKIAAKHLQIALRDKEQAVYNVRFRSSINPFNNRIRSFISFTCDTDKTNYLWEQAQIVITNLSKNITEKEVEQLRTNYIKNEEKSLKKAKTWLSRLRKSYIAYNNPKYLSEMKKNHQHITHQNIKDAADNLWNNSTISILHIVPQQNASK